MTNPLVCDVCGRDIHLDGVYLAGCIMCQDCYEALPTPAPGHWTSRIVLHPGSVWLGVFVASVVLLVGFAGWRVALMVGLWQVLVLLLGDSVRLVAEWLGGRE